MDSLNFSTLHLASLSQEDASALIGKTCDIAELVQATLGELPKAGLLRLRTKSNLFAAPINRVQKSTFTGKIDDIRTECDNYFAEIKRGVIFETKSRDSSKKEAALKLKNFLEPYWDISKQAIATQQDFTKKMLLKYAEDPTIASAAAIINVHTIFDELKISNDKLEDFYNKRNNELGGRSESGSELRQPAMKAYQKFCTIIELAVDYLPNPDLINLFNQMEELRKKYHALIPQEEITTDKSDGEIDPEV